MTRNRDRVARLSPAERKVYRRSTDDFDKQWRENPKSPPNIEEVLKDLPKNEPLRRAVLIALIRTDLEARLNREMPWSVQDYCKAFEELKEDVSAQRELTEWEETICPRAGSVAPPDYEILEEVGKGGMGIVYKAWQKSLNRLVALKMMLNAQHAGPQEQDRFLNEARSQAGLVHPNIVRVYEVGERLGQPYFSQEFVEGRSLAGRLKDATLSSREAAALVEQLAQAMHYAHQRDIVHRDLKPDNVLLQAAPGGADKKTRDATLPADPPSPAASAAWVPKITDFGLAKRIDTSSPAPSWGRPVTWPPSRPRARTRRWGRRRTCTPWVRSCTSA
jgi:hypothetical protein